MHSATPAATKGRQILVVAGPGRSGTSLFSGLVARLGMHMPQPEVVANKTNPRGFGEPRWAVDFHNELLKSIDVAVDDGRPEAWELSAKVTGRPRARERLRGWLEEQLDQSDRIVVKDPRLAWFLELYRVAAADLGADLRVATMLRDPAEVIKSREIAYGTRTGNTTRIAGWLNTMLAIESLTRDLPRATVRYTDLLDDWRAALTEADRSLGLGVVDGASPEQLADAGDLVDPSLRRSLVDWDELGLPARLTDLTRRAYDALQGLVGVPAGEQDGTREELDRLRAEYAEYYEESAEISRSRITAARADERRKMRRRRMQRAGKGRQQAEQPGARAPEPASGGLLRRLAGRLGDSRG